LNSNTIIVRPVQPADRGAWLRMRKALWPDEPDSHHADIDQYFAGRAVMLAMVLVPCNVESELVGFAELSFRPYAAGCNSSPVLFLEGWYVETESRRCGVGALLIQEAEAWGRRKGCTEFASDALIDNGTSHQAHRALGFTEVERIVCFKKNL
jgi:aminoglycoside 6'-N-acetyltransferase I